MNLRSLNPTLFDCFERAKAYPADEFGSRWKAISEDEIGEFKRATDVQLPETYLDFVRNYGEFSIYTTDFKSLAARAVWPSGKRANVEVATLVGPASMLKYFRSYREERGNHGPRLPETLFPLTFDSGYGHALLDLSPENFGKIRYLAIKPKTFGNDGYGWDEVGTITGDFIAFVEQINTEAGFGLQEAGSSGQSGELTDDKAVES